MALRALRATREPAAPAQQLALLLELERNGGERGASLEDSNARRMHLDVWPYFLVALGEHSRALGAEAAFLDAIEFAPVSNDSAPFSDGLQAKPAVEAILAQAAGRRVVMLNEEHRSSVQRAFLNELLPGLAAQGFTHLALEALSAGLVERVEITGVVPTDAGPYLRDPVLASAVRRALGLGMEVVAYDYDHPDVPPLSDPSDFLARENRRELCAAKHLAELLASDESVRVVVHAGRGHIYESDAGGWTPMGGRLAQLAGLDPLTVESTEHVEAADARWQRAAWREALALGLLDEGPIVLMHADGTRWPDSSGVDLDVFHPPARFAEELGGRADYLRLGGLRVAVNVALPESLGALDEPALLYAARVGDPEQSVPADQLVLWPEQDVAIAVMLLEPGEYEIRCVTSDGALRHSQRQRVD